jgi:hypothetical protein
MFTTYCNFIIPKAQSNELKILNTNSLQCLLNFVIDIVRDIDFEGCDSVSKEFNNWIKTLTKSQVIRLSQYVLSILDYLLEED